MRALSSRREVAGASAGTARVSIVPVLVGQLSAAKQAEYGEVFARYLDDDANFFVISSDFCHWGSRFRFQP